MKTPSRKMADAKLSQMQSPSAETQTDPVSYRATMPAGMKEWYEGTGFKSSDLPLLWQCGCANVYSGNDGGVLIALIVDLHCLRDKSPHTQKLAVKETFKNLRNFAIGGDPEPEEAFDAALDRAIRNGWVERDSKHELLRLTSQPGAFNKSGKQIVALDPDPMFFDEPCPLLSNEDLSAGLWSMAFPNVPMPESFVAMATKPLVPAAARLCIEVLKLAEGTMSFDDVFRAVGSVLLKAWPQENKHVLDKNAEDGIDLAEKEGLRITDTFDDPSVDDDSEIVLTNLDGEEYPTEDRDRSYCKYMLTLKGWELPSPVLVKEEEDALNDNQKPKLSDYVPRNWEDPVQLSLVTDLWSEIAHTPKRTIRNWFSAMGEKDGKTKLISRADVISVFIAQYQPRGK